MRLCALVLGSLILTACQPRSPLTPTELLPVGGASIPAWPPTSDRDYSRFPPAASHLPNPCAIRFLIAPGPAWDAFVAAHCGAGAAWDSTLWPDRPE